MHFVKFRRIPQQGLYFCSSFVLSIFLLFLVKDLSLASSNIQAQNCVPVQCTVWSRNVKTNYVYEIFRNLGKNRS